MKRLINPILMAGVGGLLIQPSWADTTVGDGGLEEIIVTAQRKQAGLSKTPVTVNVVSSQSLADAQIVSEADLRIAVPGLSIRAGSNSNQLNYSIRGNSQDAFSGTRPGVLPYINDVQIGGAGVSSAFYDLESVQVLKGPQGTLFGRSATGGAVLFTTVKPKNDLGGYVSVLGGNYDAAKFEGALNVPVIDDQLLFRVAGFYSERDGFQRNLYDDSTVGESEKKGVRGSLTAYLTPSISNELVVDYYDADGESMVGVISGLLPVGQPGTPPFIPVEFLYAGINTPTDRATGIATLQAFTGAPADVTAAFYDAYFSDSRRPSGGYAGALAEQRARGPFKVNSNTKNDYTAENIIVTNASVFELNEGTSIKNIFGYTDLDNHVWYDVDGASYSVSDTGSIDQPDTGGYVYGTKQLSDELQLLGKAASDRLDYIVGLYYSDEEFSTRYVNHFFDIFFGGQLQPRDFDVKNKTYAGYAHGTYQLTDSGLQMTLGARYTSEKIRKIKNAGDADLILNPIAPPGVDYDQSRTYNKVSWNIGLQDQLSDNIFLYAVSRRAYKSGGFNGNVPSSVGYGDVGGDAFREEKVTDAEAGAKFLGELAGMPFRLNSAVFHQWLDDSQRSAYTLVGTQPAAITVNVPEGTAYGAELEGVLQPISWFTVGGNLNYIEAKFKSKPTFANGQAQVFDQVPDTPQWTGSAYAEVTFPVGGALTTTLHGDVYAQSKSTTAPRSLNSAGTTVPDYTVANFRISLADETVGWSITANLKNAFDRTYYVGGLSAGEIFQVNVLVPGEPRTFTLEARYSF